jgi:hypothetical protein
MILKRNGVSNTQHPATLLLRHLLNGEVPQGKSTKSQATICLHPEGWINSYGNAFLS